MSEVGCNYNIGKHDKVVSCKKVCDPGKKMCPHHELLVAHEKATAAAKEIDKRVTNAIVQGLRERGINARAYEV